MNPQQPNRRSTLFILYYLNKARASQGGECPIYVRVTADSKTKTVFSIKRSIHPDSWVNGQPAGKTPALSEVRSYMQDITAALTSHYHLLAEKYPHVTAAMVRDAFEGKRKESSLCLFAIFDEFIERQQALVGIDVSQLTVNRYRLLKNTLAGFLADRNASSADVALSQLTKSVVLDFEHYLKTKRKSGHNTTMKYLQRLKKLVTYCMDNHWLNDNPFDGVKCTMKVTERTYLTEQELKAIMEKSFEVERLSLVRDMFIFSCFTGLAYIDCKNLTRSHIEQSPNGTYWIRTHRQKTNSRSNIPLLPIPLAIISKYADLASLKPSQPVLPLLSNVKMNAYLKEIADICGISKNLTTHLARHTFATLSLSSGIDIFAVSKLLGHSSVNTTQIYASLTDEKKRKEVDKFPKFKNIKKKQIVKR